jgi:hypothetical protein
MDKFKGNLTTRASSGAVDFTGFTGNLSICVFLTEKMSPFKVAKLTFKPLKYIKLYPCKDYVPKAKKYIWRT